MGVPVDGGIELHHADGHVESIRTPSHCHEDTVALKMAGAIEPNQWIDEAGFTYNPGFSVMTGYNNIPDEPRQAPGTDYWFLGMQNMRGGPVSILQPVLTYRSSWTAASWACCPSNITFEDYGVSQCSQLPQKAVTFDTIVLKDADGNQVTPSWDLSGPTMCNGRTSSPSPDVVSIQHGGAAELI